MSTTEINTLSVDKTPVLDPSDEIEEQPSLQSKNSKLENLLVRIKSVISQFIHHLKTLFYSYPVETRQILPQTFDLAAHQKSVLFSSIANNSETLLVRYLNGDSLSLEKENTQEIENHSLKIRSFMYTYLPVQLSLKEPFETYFQKIILAQKQIQQHDFNGTQDKIVNSLVGPILLGIKNRDLHREAALRSPEKYRGERLERWRSPDERGQRFSLDMPPKDAPFAQEPLDVKRIQFESYTTPSSKDQPDSSVFVASTIGNRASMEDAHVAGMIKVEGQKVSFFGLFDGHGGVKTATFLAKTIQEVLFETLSLLKKPLSQASPEEIENLLSVLAVKAEEKRRDILQGDQRSGSTFLLAVIINNAVWAVNAGDSRILALQGENTFQLTEDASPTSPSFSKGIKKRPGGCIFQNRLGGVLAVARAVGDEFLSGISARAKITRFLLRSDTPTTLLLGCDGLFETTTSRTIADEYRKTLDVRSLIQKAYTSGSEDNISAMVVRLG